MSFTRIVEYKGEAPYFVDIELAYDVRFDPEIMGPFPDFIKFIILEASSGLEVKDVL